MTSGYLLPHSQDELATRNFTPSTHMYSNEGYDLYRSIGQVRLGSMIVGSILSAIVTFPMVSNGLVLWTFYKFRCLRTMHDILVINMAILNLIAILGIPLHVSCMFHPSKVLTNKYLCLSHKNLFHGGIFASLLLFLGLALERLVCIVHPEYHRRFRKRHVITWSIMSILLGLLLFSLPVLGWNNWNVHQICSKHVFPDSYRILSEVLIFSLLIFNASIHCYVFRIARYHSRKISSLVRSVRRLHQRTNRKQRSKAFVTVFIMAFISTLCWLPQLFALFVIHNSDLESGAQQLLYESSYIPVVLNSGLSPLIFAYRNRHFRCAIQSLVCKRKHDCLNC